MVNGRVESTSPENDVRRKEIEKIVQFITPEEEKELKMSCEHDSTATIETENSSASNFAMNKHQHQQHQQLRFSEASPEIICYLPLHHEFESSQRDALWWSHDDYEVFSETAKSISKEVRKHRSLTGGIDEAYRRARVVTSALQDEDDVFEAMQRPSLDSGLAHWCTHGHSRRGLERSGSRVHWSFRGDDAKTMKHCILELQKVRSLAGEHITDEEVRRESLFHSKTARLFARMMGQADAAAATRSHTFMRRWSDLGSTAASNTGALDTDEQQRMRYQRTASLPQSTFSDFC